MPSPSKDLHRSTLEDQTEFISRLKADGTFLYVNEVFCRYFGRKSEELIGHSWQPCAHPEDVARVLQELSALSPENPVVVIENRIVLEDGHIRWAQFTNRGFFGPDGKLVEVQSVGRDITDRKQAEEALRASEERFRAIFDATFQFIGLLNPEGVVLEVNQAALEFCGVPREELVGKPLWENPARRHSAASQQKLQNYIARARRGEFIRFNDEVHNHRGQMVSLDISIKPQCDAQGAVAYLLFESRDITAPRLQHEERLNTAKLEALGVLAGGIAHDLNNIMMCISLNLELIRLQSSRGAVDEERITDALRNVMRASDLSKRLLTFAKGGDPVLARLDLEEVVRSALALSLTGSNLKPTLNFSPNLPPVLGDQGQLTQVIDHLVINARDATPKGGALYVTLSSAQVLPGDGLLPPGSYLKLEVRDEGCGISRENMGRIFDPYFTTKPSGSGIGLATCFSTVRRHGGSITVASEPSKGATFTILLPAAAEGNATTLAEKVSSPSSRASTGKGRILIIEDDVSLRHALSEMLGLSGFHVTLADKGETGFTQYRKALRAGKRFDVVLIDATISGGRGGVDALELLRRADPKVCAVIMSGYSQSGVMAEWQELGFRSALPKPFTCEKVVSILNRLMAKK
ncbi:MAG: hypothetical protein B9S32_17625 [Verrucomicrobia bacterium Tous-C9LFEB]|nr:MAG: hypothetical protein B9S32_17625 [Verrucomicrobia bacterium Tous-C9LFEB]